MLEEFKETILWCYRKSKWRMLKDIGGCILAVVGVFALMMMLAYGR